MRSRSVSVTGATGFVGWHVADRLTREGWSVRAVVRRGNRKPVPAGVAVVESDLSSGGLAEAFAGTDVVVHAAGIVRAPNDAVFTAVNVAGTAAAAAAAARLDARLVLISSQAAGGPGTSDARRREGDPPAPVNAYGRSKLAAECAVRSVNGLQWTILRPSAVYGPRDRGFLPLFRWARLGLCPMVTKPGMCFTFLHVHDLARAVQSAVERDESSGETLFVGHSEARSALDLMRSIAASVGRPCHPLPVPAGALSALAALGNAAWRLGIAPVIDAGRLVELRAEGFVCSVDRARAVLGFDAETGLDEGIARTADWYRSEGWL
ncbi:MAG: NAD-dependent epimerase/dehydratase family protein [Vicinamibacterales bacterium]